MKTKMQVNLKSDGRMDVPKALVKHLPGNKFSVAGQWKKGVRVLTVRPDSSGKLRRGSDGRLRLTALLVDFSGYRKALVELGSGKVTIRPVGD